MTRLVLVEDRLEIAHEDRAGTALIRFGSPGVLTVDLALPGYSGYRCVTALSGGTIEVPILAISGCDQSINETAISARLRTFVRRSRAFRLDYLPGWPATLGLS